MNDPIYTPESRRIDAREQELILADLQQIIDTVKNLVSFEQDEEDLLNKGISICLEALKEY